MGMPIGLYLCIPHHGMD
jgi:hypothetical protein